jgi:Na+-transporting NADH:ubiquinone oxidoreductase subunit NqrF
MNQETITWEEFEEKQKPIFNHLEAKKNPSSEPESCCCVNGRMFETYGEDWDFVQQQDPNKVWTVILPDDDAAEANWLISKGFHVVNRNGYIVTEVPWDENTPDVEY